MGLSSEFVIYGLVFVAVLGLCLGSMLEQTRASAGRRRRRRWWPSMR